MERIEYRIIVKTITENECLLHTRPIEFEEAAIFDSCLEEELIAFLLTGVEPSFDGSTIVNYDLLLKEAGNIDGLMSSIATLDSVYFDQRGYLNLIYT